MHCHNDSKYTDSLIFQSNKTSEKRAMVLDDSEKEKLRNMILEHVVSVEENLLSIDYRIHNDEGQFGEIIFIDITFLNQHSKKQRSVVIKRNGNNSTFRYFGKKENYFEKECVFYNLVSHLNLSFLPKIYHAQYNNQENSFIIIMENLSGLHFVDYPNATHFFNKKIFFEAISCFVDFHVYFKNRYNKNEYSLLSANHLLKSSYYMMQINLKILNSIKKVYPALISRERFEKIKKVNVNLNKIIKICTQNNNPFLTLIHGDLRLDNLCFYSQNKSFLPIIFDWQLVQLSSSTIDLASFNTSTLPFNGNQIIIEELTAYYYEQYVKKSKISIPFEEFLRLYDFSVMFCLLNWLNLIGVSNLTHKRNWHLESLINCILWLDKTNAWTKL